MKTAQKRKSLKCGERTGVPVVYGEFGDPDMIYPLECGEIEVGGCVVTGTDPDWHALGVSISRRLQP